MTLVGTGHVTPCGTVSGETIGIKVVDNQLRNRCLARAKTGVPKPIFQFAQVTHIEPFADDYYTATILFQLVIDIIR